MKKQYKEIQEIAESENLKLPFEIRENIDIQLSKTYNYIDTTHTFIENELDSMDICFYDFLACYEYKWCDAVDSEEYKLMKLYYNNQILIENVIPLLDTIKSNTI